MEQRPLNSASVALVVQSDAIERLRMAAMLRRGGFDVVEAVDANEAIRVLTSRVVDVLFSDIDLYGDMDGIELADWVRRHQPNTSVVLTHDDRPHAGKSPSR